METNGEVSTVRNSPFGAVQGSMLGLVLFCIFIRPLYDMEDLITYADDNYACDSNKELTLAIGNVTRKMERITLSLSLESFKIKCKELFLR